MRSSAVIATIVASAAMAVATPTATVNNNCDFPVYLWSVADTQGPTQTLQPGGSFSEEYQTKKDGSGCSLKISPQNDPSGQITQFEYTYTPNSPYGAIFYDISNINGEPFQDVLTQLVPELNGAQNISSCSTVNCPKGQEKCLGAYNVWNDDLATHTCPEGTSLTFNICNANSASSSNSGSSNSGSNSGSSSSSSPAPVAESSAPAPQTPTPTPVAAPAPVATTVVKVQTQAASPTPVPVAAAAVSGSAFALQWAEGDARIGEGKVSKREAHANHMERHQRIRRMHHARSAN